MYQSKGINIQENKEKLKMSNEFSVKRIEKGYKEGYAVVYVQFKGNPTEYRYVRVVKNNSVQIDGCRICFDDNYNVTGIKRLHETKGVKKLGSKKTTVEKIKDELKIELEKPPIEKVKNFAEPIKHSKYDQIKSCLMLNIPIYLAGPAGSGKNFTVEQIAKELGWNFYFTNSVQQEFKITGFIDAGGKFHETEFYKACTDEKDCIFFLDEMDASIPEVLVLLNAAIANGYFEFPNGRVDLKHIHFVSAGNTVGTGADELYSGRMVLDQATLDRFAIIEFDYDKNIELHLTNGNYDLVNFVEGLRKFANKNGIRATFSYRCLTMVTKLETGSGIDLKTILQIAVFKGMDIDTIRTFNIPDTNKYTAALKSLQTAA